MYLSELAIWTGWALLFADPLLAVLTSVLAVGFDRAARVEEAALAARFGDSWHDYAARTPRWIGIPNSR
jgi:protein-S-isoprenylcysteine O-methyltransferase Ste14